MKKKIISLALVLTLMLSLLPLAASAGFTAPKQLQGTYTSNGITLLDLVTGRKTAATVYLYPDSIAIQSGGKSLTLPLVKVSGSSNELAFSLDGHAVTLELNGSGQGTLFVNGNGIELFGGVKKVSKCLPAAMNRIIVKNTAKAMTCAAVTAAKVTSCLAQNVINTTGNILRSLLTRYTSAHPAPNGTETKGVTDGMHGIDFLPTSLELEVGETKTVTLKISSEGISMPVELSFPDCIDTHDFPTLIGVFWDQPVEITVTGVAAGSGEIRIMPDNPFFNMEVLPVTVS